MKPQDIAFVFVLLILVWKRSPRLTTLVGLLLLVLAIPLFGLYVFFTAERLTWYASSCMLLAVVLYFFQERKKA